MAIIDRIKCVLAFPLAFLLGVMATALLQLFQVGGATTTLILGGGLLLLLFLDQHAGRAGNNPILRHFAKYSEDPEDARARIASAECEKAKTLSLTRMLQLAGFAAGVVVCLVWSPIEVMDLIGRLSFS